jgi:hypothetical protein
MNTVLSKTFQILLIGFLSTTLMVGCATKDKKSKPAKEIDVSKLEKSGTFTMKAKSYALLVSGAKGEGVLTYKGKQYKIEAKSFGAGYSVGVKETDITGTVYNLNNVKDIEGSYYGIKATGTVGVGAGAANVENENGVVLSLKSTQKGVAVEVAAGIAWAKVKLAN